MTFICVSIIVEEAAGYEALSQARTAAANGAELIEWRIDQVAHDLDLLRSLLHDSPCPSIVTCRPKTEGGLFEGSETDRLQVLTTLAREDTIRYLDLELAACTEQSEELRRSCQSDSQSENDSSTRLIISTHDFDRRPRDLYRRVTRLARLEACTIAKLVWHARSLRDNLQAFEILRQRTKPTIALCMGRFGLFSRVLAPKFGGFLTFAASEPESQTAPGQPSLDELLNLYRFRKITKTTKVYGIIGWPVEHSLSPFLHNAAFDALGYDAVYLPMPIPPQYEHFKATLSAFLDDPYLDFCGASVTIPHKKHLLRFAQEWSGETRITDIVNEVGAANTISITPQGVLEITNTDGLGLLNSLTSKLKLDTTEVNSLRVAIIGAGGAARSALACLTNLGANVRIFNRTAANARSLVEEFTNRKTSPHRSPPQISAAQSIHELADFDFNLCINTTPLGMLGGPDPNASPIQKDFFANQSLDSATLFFDTVYAPAETPFLKSAAHAGFPTLGGLEMLVHQAAEQFQLWTGSTPELAPWLESARKHQSQQSP